MSCPDWRSLLKHRLETVELEPPAEWPQAVEHLERCPACRRQALSLDPSMLFAVSAPLPVSDDEVGEIKANVRTLVRARAAERTTHRLRRGLGRIAAAAAVVGLMVLMPTHSSRQALSPGAAAPTPAGDAALSTLGDEAFAEAPAPVIEPLDLPAARIYQLGGGDFSIVMVVDDSIDV